MTTKMRVEIENTSETFRFRLVKGDQVTQWAGYTGRCYMEGYVAATEYYLPPELALKPIPGLQFLELTSVT